MVNDGLSHNTPDPAATGSGASTPRESEERVESHAQHSISLASGKSVERLTRDSILTATRGGYDVFARRLSSCYPGGKIEPGRKVSSPFHPPQSTPSFNVYVDSSGVWRYKDFAHVADVGDCFDFIARLHNLDVRTDFPEVLRRIAEECGLALDTAFSECTITSRPFTPEDVEYWGRSGVTTETLTRYGVQSVQEFTGLKKRGGTYTVRVRPGELVFAYPYGSGAWKVYRPHAEKGWRFVFLGKKSEGTVWGLQHIPKGCDVLLLTAGEKDALTAIAHGFAAVTLNGESASLSPVQLSALRSRTRVVVSVYDLDPAGQNGAKRLRQKHGIPTLLLPDWLTEKGGKDLTDFFMLGGSVEELRGLIETASATAAPIITDATETDSLFAIGTEEGESEEYEPEEGNALPLIPAAVYAALPPMLGRIVALLKRDPETQPHERDVFLTSALPVLAGAMPNVETEGREGKEGVNLYTLIVAEAGSGKGAMRYGRVLGREIDKRLYEESKAEYALWQQQCKDGETFDPPPLPVSFLIAGNSSSRAVVESLAANPCAVMVESEIRTVSATLTQDWGSFADILLKCFHREPVSITRKGRDRIRVECPALSVCLSGTPEAVRDLIPGVEDGLFSRIGFYRFRSVERWRSQRPRSEESEIESALTLAALSLNSLHAALATRTEPLLARLTPEQWEQHTQAFTRLFGLTDLRLAASVKRAGVMAVRIAALLAVVRVWEEEGTRIAEWQNVSVSDAEVDAGVMLAATYLQHATAVALTLPKHGGKRMHGRKQKFFEALPVGVFRTAAALAIAVELEISDRSAKRYLKEFATSGLLAEVAHGEYRKDDWRIGTSDTLDTADPCTDPAVKCQSAESVNSASVPPEEVTSSQNKFRV